MNISESLTNDTATIIRLVFTLLFVGTFIGGAYVLRNYQRLFGEDPDVPSETGSSRAYSKVQIFMIWVHAVVLTGAFALLFH